VGYMSLPANGTKRAGLTGSYAVVVLGKVILVARDFTSRLKMI